MSDRDKFKHLRMIYFEVLSYMQHISMLYIIFILYFQWTGGEPCRFPGEKGADKYSVNSNATSTYDHMTLN